MRTYGEIILITKQILLYKGKDNYTVGSHTCPEVLQNQDALLMLTKVL